MERVWRLVSEESKHLAEDSESCTHQPEFLRGNRAPRNRSSCKAGCGPIPNQEQVAIKLAPGGFDMGFCPGALRRLSCLSFMTSCGPLLVTTSDSSVQSHVTDHSAGS